MMAINCAQIIKHLNENDTHARHRVQQSGKNELLRLYFADNHDDQVTSKERKTAQEKVAWHRKKYPIMPPCKDSCRKKCRDKITEEHRGIINHTFWGLSFPGRRGWFDAHINVLGIKQRTTGVVGANAKRKNTLSYTLPLPDGVNIHVCKKMFMCTLGIKTDGMITEFVNTKLNAPEQAVSPTAEGRGKHEPWNKVDRGAIKEHINSYHPTVSHYKVSHAPLRRYLEPGLTISFMWQDFCEKQKRVSYELYRQVFESEKITFGEPSQDECETCLAYELHVKESGENADHDADTCEECIDGHEHKIAYTKARIEYQKEIPNGFNVYAVDMQRVILLPKLSTKESFFVSRLIVFNETFARMGADHESDYVVLWHEGSMVDLPKMLQVRTSSALLRMHPLTSYSGWIIVGGKIRTGRYTQLSHNV